MSVIAIVPTWFAILPDDITQFADQMRIRLFSQSIKGISGLLQKLLKYFNGTAISTIFALSLPVWTAAFAYN